MIKPIKIFIYYIVLMSVFVGLGYIIPPNGFTIGNSSVKIKWFSLQNVFSSEKTGEVTDSILHQPIIEKTDSSIITRADSSSQNKIEKTNFVSPQIFSGNIKLEYDSAFSKKLNKFYGSISSCDSLNKVIRILHFGDSQIEGDRITRYLRELFQNNFKGSGPGLIPVYDPQKLFPSIWIKNSGKWKEHAVYNYPRDIKNNNYGLLGKVSTIDSSGVATVHLSKSFLALPQSKKFYKARLFVKNIDSLLVIKSAFDDVEIGLDTLFKENKLTEINWSFAKSPKKLSLQFMTKDNPLFLGISLDSTCGVAVDNIAMRGQLSPRLDKTNMELFKSMANYMNIGMVILQYGTNMVPTVAENYNFYRISMFNQLNILKEALPEIPVIVVGVGDVGKIEGGKVNSLKHVKKIIEAQKKATLNAGFAFFNLYDAMGGEGSIIKWTEGDPKMAMSDYTHFNKQGGKKVANWLYNAIMHEYKTHKN